MKREFLEGLELEGGVKLDKETIDKIMAENGKDINKEKAKTTTAEQQRDTYKRQYEETNDELVKLKDLDYEGMKTKLSDLQTKYDTDTKELNDKLKKQAYENSAKEYLDKYKFSNDRVKKSILEDFIKKDFKLEDDKFLGADDFIKGLQESEPDSFILEDDGKQDPPPRIVKPSGGGDSHRGKMSLEKAMEYVNEHPDVDINTLI